MCIALYKPAENIISKDILAQCFKANSDGAGFMYVEDKQLHVQKGFFKFDDFYEAYKEHEHKQAVLHFRIKTHGPISTDNCHPFNINKGLGFVHNGIISGFGSTDHSDTRDFNTKILQPLVAKWGNLSLFQPAIKELVEARIGYSKLIFLDRHGNYDIFNESKGTWDNGVWYSNTSYKPVDTTWYSQKKVSDTSTSTSYKAPSALVRNSHYKQPGQILEVGELVVLRIPHYDVDNKKLYPIDELLEVIAVNSDYTADLMLDDGKDVEILYNIPFRKFDFYEVEVKQAVDDKPKDNLITFPDSYPYDY